MQKTILITGATDGIGRLTAKVLAAQGHRILLHGRSDANLGDAAAEISGDVLTFKADLSSLEDTYALAEAVKAKVDGLNVLINNAGVFKVADARLPNGQDLRFMVNTLAPYALTKALLPIIAKDGRVINVSSAAQAPVDLGAMGGTAPLEDMAAYAQSKRAIALWSAALAEAYPEGPVFLAVNPGSLLAKKMVQEGFGVAGHDLSIGANILRRLAVGEAFAGDTGKYWDNDAGRFTALDKAQAHDLLRAVDALI